MAFLDKTGLERLWYQIAAKLGTKVDAEDGKGLSTNDYTTAEKEKLSGIDEGANKITVDSALSSSSTNPVQNKVVYSELSGKVPTSRTVNGKALSANITLSASDVGAAASSHSHNDLYYTESEIDSKVSTLNSSISGKADSSHTHTISDVENLQSALDEIDTKSSIFGVTASSSDGATYTADVDGIDSLTAGVHFVMIPAVVSTSTTVYLNVNGLGNKLLRRRVSNSTITTVSGSSANWLGANKPIEVMYDGTYWVVDFVRPNATDLYGTVAVENGGVPSSTTDDNGKFLRVVEGAASWVAMENAEEASF